MTAEWAEQPASTDNQGIPGRTLAAQREALGWTVEQVADQLKLAVRQVIALEAGDYANLPSPAVVRGFVRAYAKVVRLDPVPLVAQIALDTPTGTENNTSATVRRDNKPASFSEVRFPTNGKRAALPLGLIAGVAVVAALAVSVWKFDLLPTSLFSGSSTSTTAASAPATPTDASVTVLPTPVVPGHVDTAPAKPGDERALQSTSVPLISVPPPSAGSVPGAAAAPAPAAGTPAAGAAAAPAGANTLVLNIKADSWIEVRRAKGAPLLSKLARAGSTETVEVTEPVTLIVGKPTAVDASLRGSAVALPSIPGGTVARVAIK